MISTWSSSARPAIKHCCAVFGAPMMLTSLSPAASFAWWTALPKPSVTKVKVMYRSLLVSFLEHDE